MELSQHQSEVCGSSGKTDKLGCLTGGVLAILGPYEPCSHCTAQLHSQRATLRGTSEPRAPRGCRAGRASGTGGECREQAVGCGRGEAAIRSPLPLCLALLAAVPKLPSLPLRCLLCSSPKAPGPGDLSRLPQLGFGSSNFRHFAVLLSRCSVEEKRLCREASLALPHHCWLFLCLSPRLAPAWCLLLRDAGGH